STAVAFGASRLPDARSPAELAGAARPLRRRQGRRNPHAATRDRGTATHQPSADTDLARSRRTQRAELLGSRIRPWCLTSGSSCRLVLVEEPAQDWSTPDP